jgi:glyoxylase-like metal-dependent hydrolase (beta-lactamase superfamily II)/ferredoxin
MAKEQRRHLANVPGPWFVDDSCIDCDASRQCAPALFGAAFGQSVVVRQPETEAEVLAATRAMLACPTSSIGVTGPKPRAAGLFPEPIEGGVFYCGYNARESYGANAFFAAREGGNLLIDAPRWVPDLARRIEALGGIKHILLTHRDDVADAERYAAHFGAQVWIHEADREAAPFATDVMSGPAEVTVAPGVLAIPAPGHTQGSVVYLLEQRYLFSGDSLYWSREQDDLSAFHEQCWFSWEEQARSLARLIEYPFEWVLAGHGNRRRAPAAEMRERLAALVKRMETKDAAWWREVGW